MSLGKIVLAPRAGAIPELIDNHQSGYLYDMGSTKSLILAIKYIVQNNGEWPRIKKNAYIKISNKYNSKVHDIKFIKIIIES